MVAKGLEGVVVAQTKLSQVNGQAGRLTYYGYDLRDLVGRVSFEEVAYLFWHGELPNRSQLEELSAQMRRARAVPEPVLEVARAFPPGTDPMDALRTLVSALGAGQPLRRPDLPQAIELTAQIPLLIAVFHRVRRGEKPLASRDDLDTASNYLYLLSGREPTAAQARALNAYLVLLADHGLNASTFAARVVASTRSDLGSCITAAIGALKGPLHGGAPFRVLEMVQAVGRKENAEEWLQGALARGERLMGFGHRLYRATDPRAEILRDVAREASSPELFELAREVEETGLRLLAENKPRQRLYTNVEFYSAIVLHSVGLPKDLFTATFAVSRASGWTAHVLEQVSDNHIIRPTAEYVGPEPHPVTPLDER